MLTAVIVEDEHNVGLLIKALVNWQKLSIDCLGIFDDGKAAFDYIRSVKPDIVITDIRMPKMDGLRLIQGLKRLGLQTKFIVISGYRHFEYAHSAIKYGVEDYLLKPINQAELNKALTKICNEKKHEQEQQYAKLKIQQKLTQSRSIMHRELVYKILDGNLDMQKANHAFSLSFQDALFQSIAIKLDRKDITWSDPVQDNLVADKIEAIVAAAVKPHVIEYIASSDDSLRMLFLLNFKGGKELPLNKAYGEILHIVQDYVYAYNAYQVTIGVGIIVDRFDQLRDSVLASIKALQYRIRLGTGNKIYYKEHSFESYEGYTQLVKRIQANIAKSVESFDADSVSATIEKTLQSLDTHVSPSLLYSLAEEIVIGFFDHVIFNDPEQIAQEKKKLLALITHAYTVDILVVVLQKKLSSLVYRYKEQQTSQINKPVRDAKRYIEAHFNEKIGLEDIANIVALNPVYFSVIFKKETGSNFNDYLVNVRIKAAKTMLRETNDTILMIGEHVGYKDTKYFSQLFKKRVGINPSKYRKLYS